MTVSQSEIDAMLNEELLARRTKVMFLRNAGATWDKIAEEVGVSAATCRKDYGVVCRDLNNEQPAYVVARHRAVIFDIQRAMYPAMMRGDVKAATVILKALHREANLLGLNAPTRILAGVSDVEFANEAARLIERINHLDPDTLKELERANHTVIDATVEPDPAAATDGHTGDAQLPDRAASDPGPGQGAVQEAGQPERDTGTDGDQGAAGCAGEAEPAGSAGDVPDADDDPDADWSNI